MDIIAMRFRMDDCFSTNVIAFTVIGCLAGSTIFGIPTICMPDDGTKQENNLLVAPKIDPKVLNEISYLDKHLHAEVEVGVTLYIQSFKFDDGNEAIHGSNDMMMHVGKLGASLRKLYLHQTPITDEGIKHLSNTGSIEELGINVERNLQESGYWEFRGGTITDKSMSVIAQLPKLRRLSLTGIDITDEGIALLAAGIRRKGVEPYYLPIEYLRLDETRITGKCFKQLRTLPIRELSIKSVKQLDPENLHALKEITTLKVLELGQNRQLDKVDLKFLSEMAQLEKIGVMYTPAIFRAREGLVFGPKVADFAVGENGPEQPTIVPAER